MNETTSKPQRLIINKRLFDTLLLISIGIVFFMIFIHQTFTVSLQNERKNQTSNLSTVAIKTINYFYQLELSGELSHEKAQKFAMNSIKSATFSDDGYFWIIDGQGTLLMQPFLPDKIGIKQINWTDSHGRYIFQEFVNVSRKGGGWVDYYWPKLGSKDEYPKLSYVKYFKPWDWIIGTGVYLDDMNTQIYMVVTKASSILFAAFIVFMAIAFSFVNFYFRKLGELSIRDPLTNLYSKRFLDEIKSSILGKSIRLTNQILAVTFIDIDHFKSINDTYGHDYGDIVLKQMSNSLINATRADDYCIRYGGEEFVIVGFYDNQQAAFNAIERVRECISLLFFCAKDTEFSITLSAGIAFHTEITDLFDDIIKRADQQLYRSKQSGRNRTSM